MKVSLQFKDDGASPGTFHCEATIEFGLNMKTAFKALQKLQKANIPSVIAKALSEKEPEDDKATDSPE